MTTNANTVNAEQCNTILNAVCDAINKDYGVVPRQPLSKRNVKGYGPEQAIRNIKTARDRWGRYSNCNYGVTVDGFMVVDVDGNQGTEDLARLENEHGFVLPRDFALPSPSGGLHIFLPYRTGCSLNGHLKVGGKKTAIEVFQWNHGEHGKPRIVTGPGSILENGEYTGTLPDMPQLFAIEVPQAFADLVSDQARSSNIYPIRSDRPDYVVGAGRGNEEVHEEDLEARITARDVEEMLSVIPADISGGGEYGDWFKVTAGLANYFNDSEEYDAVKDLWFAWRRRDPDGYRDSDDGRLDSLAKDTGNAIGIGSVIYIAKQHGYQAPKNVQHRSILEEIQADTPNIMLGGQSRFVRRNPTTGAIDIMAKADVRDLYSGREEFVNGRMVNPIDLFMRSSVRSSYDGMGLCPPGSTCPAKMFNTWQGYAVDPVEGDVREWLGLMERMFPEDGLREWIHNWIALVIREPGVRAKTVLAMRGPEGTGKSLLASTIASLFGRHATNYEDVDLFLDKHNTDPVNNVFTFLDEAMWPGNSSHASKLKGLLTRDTARVNPKGTSAFEVPERRAFMIASNNALVAPVDGEGRRYTVTTVRYNKDWPLHDSKWGRLAEHLRTAEFRQALLHYYLNFEITVPDAKNSNYETEDLAAQRQLTLGNKAERDPNGIYVKVLAELVSEGKACQDSDGNWAIGNEQVRKIYKLVTGNTGHCPSQWPGTWRMKLQAMFRNFDLNFGYKRNVMLTYKDADGNLVKEKGSATIMPNSPGELGILVDTFYGNTEGDWPETWELGEGPDF